MAGRQIPTNLRGGCAVARDGVRDVGASAQWRANLFEGGLPLGPLDGAHEGAEAALPADKGYDHAFCRLACRQRGIVPRIARKGIESSERLGRHRWVVESTQPYYPRCALDV